MKPRVVLEVDPASGANVRTVVEPASTMRGSATVTHQGTGQTYEVFWEGGSLARALSVIYADPAEISRDPILFATRLDR